jgi:membrane protein implicated in regulation of membrane protease activity
MELQDWIWWVFGVILILLEFILPGLVVVFLGLAALTVGVLEYFDLLTNLSYQILAWFIISIVYCLGLRMIVIKFYPSDTKKQNVDEDVDVIGMKAVVCKDIGKDLVGRIRHGETTWPAESENDEMISSGEEVIIVGRDNLTWIVKKIE